MTRALHSIVLSLVILLASLAFAPRALASQVVHIEFDPHRTTIAFTLGDFMHDIHGMFQLRSGSLTFDRQSGAASGSLIVEAASGESGVAARDAKMKREILETARFPQIVFTPSTVIGSDPEEGSATVQVRGTFHIHGTEHEATLVVSLNVTGSAFELTTAFPVPYVAWGMKDPSAFILRVGKQVDIRIHAAGTVH